MNETIITQDDPLPAWTRKGSRAHGSRKVPLGILDRFKEKCKASDYAVVLERFDATTRTCPFCLEKHDVDLSQQGLVEYPTATNSATATREPPGRWRNSRSKQPLPSCPPHSSRCRLLTGMTGTRGHARGRPFRLSSLWMPFSIGCRQASPQRLGTGSWRSLPSAMAIILSGVYESIVSASILSTIAAMSPWRRDPPCPASMYARS